MKRLCLLTIGVVVGWAASGVDWSREAVGDDKVIVEPPTGRPITVPQQADYLTVETLDEAIEVLQRKLKQSPILPLVNKDTVRAAIVTSLEGRRRENEKAIRESRDNERGYLQSSADHFAEVVSPIYESIIKDEKWPSRAFFIISNPTSTHAIQLHVDARKPDGTGYTIGDGIKLTGYALPILTVEFGDSGPPDESGTLIIGTSRN
jgi:hypothetical protein